MLAWDNAFNGYVIQHGANANNVATRMRCLMDSITYPVGFS